MSLCVSYTSKVGVGTCSVLRADSAFALGILQKIGIITVTNAVLTEGMVKRFNSSAPSYSSVMSLLSAQNLLLWAVSG